MPLNIANKPQLTGIIILFTGVTLLAFTFINAFFFLQEPFSILSTGDLGQVFGESLAPLIQACIRLMYLGVMGWIGSLLTVRSIPLVTHKHIPVAAPSPAVQTAPTQPQPVKQPKPTAPKPQQATQQPKTTPPSQSPQPTPQPHKEELQAILIPPEQQREE